MLRNSKHRTHRFRDSMCNETTVSTLDSMPNTGKVCLKKLICIPMWCISWEFRYQVKQSELETSGEVRNALQAGTELANGKS